MLLTKHEIIENRTSGDFSRELQKTETYELRAREVRVRSRAFQTSFHVSFDNYHNSSQ